ncbi:MAG: c-type cytochrome, partial [Gammaproteobacteria bacterium]|nr:c-type cytochrome [Gammaproteobacteria bacterium]
FQSLERGLELALRGKPEYMVPRCDSCHGPQGEGFGPHFPPLAGQPQSYIISQINKWQNGQRDNDHLAMMKNTANMLTDGDKINVAKYYSNQSYSVNVK